MFDSLPARLLLGVIVGIAIGLICPSFIVNGVDVGSMVMQVILEFDGVLPFNDKASPEVIAREFKLSKNAFKRAVGHLLKEGKIEITEKSIIAVQK